MKTLGTISNIGPESAPEPPVITHDVKTGLPRIECKHVPIEEMTPEQIADLLLEQEVTWTTAPPP